MREGRPITQVFFKFLLGSDLLTFYWPKENHMSTKFKVSSEAECCTQKSKAMEFYEKGHGDREKWRSKATAEVLNTRWQRRKMWALFLGGPVWYLGVRQKWLVFTLSLSQRWLEGLGIGKKSSWQTQLQIVYLVIHGDGERCGLS